VNDQHTFAAQHQHASSRHCKQLREDARLAGGECGPIVSIVTSLRK